jgi:hypothetical protein
MKSIILFLSVILFGESFGQSKLPEPSNVRKRYKDSLEMVIAVVREGKTPKTKAIEYCIPETSDEYLLFFSFDYQKENSKAFDGLNNHILQLATNGNKSVLKKYLAMSQFVDGYFAESYFDNVNGIIGKQKDLFCKTITKLPQEKTKRLSEYKAQAGCH